MTKAPPPLDIGLKAPDFELPDQDNNLFSLSAQQGKWVVIYFYPKALTSGCTVQACGVRDHHAEWAETGAVVVGISADPIEQLSKFRAKEALDFPLLADTDHAVCAIYGTWQEKSMYGRTYWGVSRTTYIIDPAGRIAHVIPKVNPKTHAADVLAWLKKEAQ